jgi:hypothetical protein
MVKQSLLLDGLTLKDGTNSSATTNLRCVTSQKCEDLIYTAAELRYHALCSDYPRPFAYTSGYFAVECLTLLLSVLGVPGSGSISYLYFLLFIRRGYTAPNNGRK